VDALADAVPHQRGQRRVIDALIVAQMRQDQRTDPREAT
jgi:hypothetical protein